MNGLKKITLLTVANGAAPELFQRELEKVLANVADINTSPDDKRKILIEVSILPSEARDMADITVKCTSRLAGVRPVRSPVFLGKDEGKQVAYGNDPKQVELALNPPAPPNVSKLEKGNHLNA